MAQFSNHSSSSGRAAACPIIDNASSCLLRLPLSSCWPIHCVWGNLSWKPWLSGCRTLSRKRLHPLHSVRVQFTTNASSFAGLCDQLLFSQAALVTFTWSTAGAQASHTLTTFYFIADQITINGSDCLIPSNPPSFKFVFPSSVSWEVWAAMPLPSPGMVPAPLPVPPLVYFSYHFLILSLTITTSGWNSSINRVHLLKALPWLLFVLYCIP